MPTAAPTTTPPGKDLQRTNLGGLDPAGEGPNYAGSILSAKVGGIRVAKALAIALTSPHPSVAD